MFSHIFIRGTHILTFIYVEVAVVHTILYLDLLTLPK